MQHSKLFLALVVALTACAHDAEEAAELEATTASAQPAAPGETEPLPVVVLNGKFNPAIQTRTPIRGQAFVTELPENEGDPFKLTVQLEEVPPGEHAWHIHRGSCELQNAPIVVALSATADKPGIAEPLRAGKDRKVEATATVPLNALTVADLRNDDYSVHVHMRGGADHGPSLACATL